MLVLPRAEPCAAGRERKEVLGRDSVLADCAKEWGETRLVLVQSELALQHRSCAGAYGEQWRLRGDSAFVFKTLICEQRTLGAVSRRRFALSEASRVKF